MTDDQKRDVELKLKNLTIPNARQFWNEITEWLDSLITGCDRKYEQAKTYEDFKELQILKRLCERMKKLPENMAICLRQQLAEPSSGDKIDEEMKLNFFAPTTQGVKQEVKHGRRKKG